MPRFIWLSLNKQGRSWGLSRGWWWWGGGGVTLCHTKGTYQIGMSTFTPCFSKSDDFFFRMRSERGGELVKGGGGGGGWKGQAYKIATYTN